MPLVPLTVVLSPLLPHQGAMETPMLLEYSVSKVGSALYLSIFPLQGYNFS